MALTLNNNLKTLKVGDYFWAKYTAPTSGSVGTFSDVATKTDAEVSGQEIPVASSATPNGYFKFIMVEDWSGNKRLVADRNIQHSISWDTLNTSGIASGSGLSMLFDEFDSKSWSFAIRLLTGGISASDLDNEWDKYIVNSTLNGTIVSGDEAVWNWSSMYSWTSTVPNSSVGTSFQTRRTLRGDTSLSAFESTMSHQVITWSGFRPVLEVSYSFTPTNKTLILSNGEYKKWVLGSPSIPKTYSNNIIPVMTSNTAPSGVASASSIDSSPKDAWVSFDSNDTLHWFSGYGTPNNQWLQYQFTSPKIIEKYSVIAQNGTTSPKDFRLEASNDGVNYFILDTKSNIADWSTTTKDYEINNNTSYTHYRIFVVTNNGSTTSTALAFKLYEVATEESPSTPPSWSTVSSSLPTSTQFLDEGMDDLSIFNRTVQELDLDMVDKTDILLGVEATGKVYQKTLDLNKYMDIRSVKVEVK